MPRKSLAVWLITLALGVVAVSCAQPPPSPLPPAIRGVSTPTPLPRPAWVGLYENLDFVPDPPIAGANQFKVGTHYAWHWDTLEPTNQSFAWDALTAWINRADSYGYLINIGFVVHAQPKGVPDAPNDGMILPSWMLTAQGQNVYYLVCNGHRVPYYWSAAYVQQYAELVNALAQYLASTPGNKVDLYTIGMANYGEIDPSQDTDWECLRAQIERDDAAGRLGHIYSGAGNSGTYKPYTYCTKDTNRPTGALCSNYQGSMFWADVLKYFINIHRSAWQTNGLSIYAQASIADNFLHGAGTKEVADYLISIGWGIGHNKVQADEYNWLDVKWGTGQYDPFVRGRNTVYAFGEMADSFNERVDSDPREMNIQQQVYYAIYNAIDKGIDVLRVNFYIHPDGRDVNGAQYRIPYDNPAIAAALQDFTALAGHSVQSAPYVLALMRETQNVQGYMPQCGNFSFGLRTVMCPANTPNQNMTGKCTTPPQPPPNFDGCAPIVYNVLGNRCVERRGTWDANCDPRWRMARMLDRGNPRLYFDVDDVYTYGVHHNARVTVEYVDIGTDAIAVEYNSVSGQRVKVTKAKTNTRAWTSWTFVLPDMRASNELPGNADFAVYNNNDGTEYVHKVIFQRADSATPTPPPTPTPFPTPTPSVTVTPTPTPLWYSGDYSIHNAVFADTHINGDLPTTPFGGAQYFALRASSSGAPLNSQSPTTRQSALLSAALPFPNGATIVEGLLYVWLYSFSGSPMQVYPRPVYAQWHEGATWRNRLPDAEWQAYGAYGSADVGPRGTPVTITAQDVDRWIVFDVRQATTYNLVSVKLEPVCNAAPSCDSEARFYAAQSLGEFVPFFSVRAAYSVQPTPTPTPTVTPTWLPTATPTPTLLPTATPTPTIRPTLTPTPDPTVFAVNGALRINEVCTNPVRLQDNWPDGRIDAKDRAIEIVNLTSAPVDLSRYSLFAGQTVRLQGRIPARGYKVLYHGADGIYLSPWGGTVELYDNSASPLRLVDSFTYGGQAEDACWARLTDGHPTWVERTLPTLGMGNNVWAVTPTPTR